MAVIQLTGGSVAVPPGALNIRLSLADGAELVLVGPDGAVLEPNFRVTRSEVVVVPSGPVTVMARAFGDPAFRDGARLGVTIKSAAGTGDEVVRPPVEVGGRQAITLVEIAGGGVADLVGQSSRAEHGWMQRGTYAYHVNHGERVTTTTRWACVLDGSATAHRAAGPEAFHAWIELALGIAASGFGAPPDAWLVSTDPPRDVTSALDGDAIDWAAALDHPPAPWPSVLPAVRQAAGRLPDDGALVLLVDGVPVDYREVLAEVAGRGLRCVVVALGRSRHGARAEDRPRGFWEEELAALDGFDRVAAVSSLAGLADSGSALADAMFPGGAS